MLRQTSGPLLYAKGAYPTKVVKPVTKPVTPVTQPTKPTTGGGVPLAATGGAPVLALISLLMVGGALVLRRRRVG